LKCKAERDTANEKHIFIGPDPSASEDRNHINHKNFEFQTSLSKRSVRMEPRRSKEYQDTILDHPGSIAGLFINHSDANL
jgi:hypothetical protein